MDTTKLSEIRNAIEKSSMSTTDKIIWSILSMYFKKGANMLLRFEHRNMRMIDFLAIIVPRLGSIYWPIHKEEIGHVWHSLLIIIQDLEPYQVDLALPPFTTTYRCKEVPLDPQIIFEALSDDSSWEVSALPSKTIADLSRHTRAATDEVRISTFKTTWFISSYAFIKRFCITKEAMLTRIFLLKEICGEHTTRYYLTILPHVHLHAKYVRRHSDESWHCVASPTDKLWNPRFHVPPNPSDLTVLLWNVRATVNSRFGKGFFTMVSKYKPHLVIITGTTTRLTTNAHEVTQSLGYTEMLRQESDIGQTNGFWILWKPTDLTVFDEPCYKNGKHFSFTARLGRTQAGEEISDEGLLIKPL